MRNMSVVPFILLITTRAPVDSYRSKRYYGVSHNRTKIKIACTRSVDAFVAQTVLSHPEMKKTFVPTAEAERGLKKMLLDWFDGKEVLATTREELHELQNGVRSELEPTLSQTDKLRRLLRTLFAWSQDDIDNNRNLSHKKDHPLFWSGYRSKKRAAQLKELARRRGAFVVSDRRDSDSNKSEEHVSRIGNLMKQAGVVKTCQGIHGFWRTMSAGFVDSYNWLVIMAAATHTIIPEQLDIALNVRMDEWQKSYMMTVELPRVPKSINITIFVNKAKITCAEVRAKLEKLGLLYVCYDCDDASMEMEKCKSA